MTRLPEIEKLLLMWGEWSRAREEGVRGYPKLFYSVPVPSSTADKSLPFAPILMQIDGIMGKLKRDKKKRKEDLPDYKLYQIGWLWYVEGQPATTISRLCGCSLTTVYNRLYRLRGIVKVKLLKD